MAAGRSGTVAMHSVQLADEFALFATFINISALKKIQGPNQGLNSVYLWHADDKTWEILTFEKCW